MGDSLPLVTLFGAVAAAVWVGGYLTASVITILGYAACNYLFIAPRGAFAFDAESLVGLTAYLFTSALIIAIGEAMRRAQARASARGEVLRVTLGSIGDAVITTDIEGRVTYLNRVAESLTGWSHQDALEQPLAEVFRIINEDTRRPVESPATRALRQGIVVGLANHTLLVGKDGVERPIDDSAAPIRDDNGVVSGCVLIFRDVSERRQWEKREAARMLSARLLASIVESSDDAIISKTLDGVIQSWNAAAERLFGYTSSEAIGRHISLVIPPDRIAEEDHIIATLKAGTRIEHFETERMRKDGQRILVSLTVSPIKDDDSRVVGASKIARDISAQKLAESERQKFVTLVENSTDFIGICDLNAVPIFVNRAGLQMVGLENMEEARRVNVRDFFFPEDRSRMMDEFFPSVVAHGHGEIEVRFRHFKTGQARWMAYKVLKLDDESGRTVAFATVSQDVTERRHMEDNLRGLAANLAEADRRKDEFLATLAHELRNPLAPIRTAVQLLKMRKQPDAEGQRLHAVIDRQVQHLVRMVDDLLDVSRVLRGKVELRREPIEIADAIAIAVETSRPLLDGQRQELKLELPGHPVTVHGDAVRLSQVMANLLNNASKYSDVGATIQLTASEADGEVAITVRDAGAGIAADLLPRVFEPFVQADRTLERSRGGLGIGLTLVKKIVELHHGRVAAESAGLGQGSTFTIRLPAHAGATVAAQEAEQPPVIAFPARVLIVDDNVDAAESLALLLQSDGHTVNVAHNGVDAVHRAESWRPDIAVLDVGLPGMNGYEVASALRERGDACPELIAVTGYGQAADTQRALEAGFRYHLVKPVDARDLTTAIARCSVTRQARRV
jgi:PAS domain S-box-containing protein